MNKSVLQEEIKQDKPFGSPEEEAFLNVMRTCGILVGRVSKILKEHGVTQPQYNILRILRGSRKQGLPCLEIAGRMVTREPDITRLLDRLEKSGYVMRVRSTEDRRVVIVKITSKGVKLLDGLDLPVSKTLEQSLGHLNREELKDINHLMVKARSSFGEEQHMDG